MASILTGRATIFGFAGWQPENGADFAMAAWTGAGRLFPQSVDAEDNFDQKTIADGDNEPHGFIFSGQLFTARLSFTPVSVSGTNTIANARTSLAPPTMGARVTLANFPLASFNTATWVYVGGWKISLKFNDVASYELRIARSPNRDLSVPIT